MKKVLATLAALALAVSLFAIPALGEAAEPLRIVCTIFPQYDWVRAILGDDAQRAMPTLLLDSGVDLHSYSPTAEDIAKIAESDLFIYVGGESDAWVERVLASLGDRAPRAIALTDLVETVPEEIVEGMEHAHEDEHAAEIVDRQLSNWSGSWQSVLPYVEDGSVSKFLASKAQENGETIAEARDRYRKRFGSPYRTIEIGERGVRLWSDGASVEAEYAYIGWRAAESDHETGAWYVFERAAQDGDAPKYIAFNDHGTGDAAHFHLRYGPEGPDALARMADWAPTFFDAAADAATIDRALAGHGHEQDEHVWLSLKAASKITRGLCDALCALRPDRADAYRANADAYIEALLALDARYRETIDSAARKTMLFADRFPFRYLADDYGLAYYAAFSGCSAETEASFETVAFLAGKVDELDLPAVLVIEGAAHKIANTVIANSAGKDAKILVLNSLQSVTARDLAAGVSYLDTMEQNLAVLQEALN